MKNDLLSYKHFRGGIAWIILVIGLAFYVWGYFGMTPSIWKELILKIADILVIGVIIGYLSNAAQFLGVFKQDLQDIIYSKEFLKKRNDLPWIWENVTKAMFRSKFPAISRDLIDIISRSYLQVDNVSYYNDYEVFIDVSWVDKARKIIKVQNKINFDLIAENKDKFEFPLKSWLMVEGLNENDYFVKVSDYIVNGDAAKVISNNECVKDGFHIFTCIIELMGNNKYEISKNVEKQFSLAMDSTICFKAQFLINKLSVSISFPDDMCACFINRGTVEDFKKVDTKKSSFTMKYKGLILPNQGYVIVLKEK